MALGRSYRLLSRLVSPYRTRTFTTTAIHAGRSHQVQSETAVSIKRSYATTKTRLVCPLSLESPSSNASRSRRQNLVATLRSAKSHHRNVRSAFELNCAFSLVFRLDLPFFLRMTSPQKRIATIFPPMPSKVRPSSQRCWSGSVVTKFIALLERFRGDYVHSLESTRRKFVLYRGTAGVALCPPLECIHIGGERVYNKGATPP
jgi:hypothetical protein